MLQKLKITTYVFILCIFGLTLTTVSPIFAEDSAAFDKCENISKHRRGKRFVRSTDKISCYKSLVRELMARVNKLESREGPVDPRVDDDASAIQRGRNLMQTGDTERRTGMTCAKITGCKMESQGQDEK
jgi:hypothetical protein